MTYQKVKMMETYNNGEKLLGDPSESRSRKRQMIAT